MTQYFLPYNQINRKPDDRILYPVCGDIITIIHILLHYYENWTKYKVQNSPIVSNFEGRNQGCSVGFGMTSSLYWKWKGS